MTPLPHNPAITVIDLPEGTVVTTAATGDWATTDTGNYKLICLGLQATEDEAREIVQYVNEVVRGYRDYENPGYVHFTALQSLASLITANGWKNPFFLRNV